MSVKEGCFLIGAALLRISTAAELAAWASNKKRFEEANGFLAHASMDISKALVADFIKAEDADVMRKCIQRHNEAVEKKDTEEAQEALAELTMRAHDITFQKVVACECGRKES